MFFILKRKEETYIIEIERIFNLKEISKMKEKILELISRYEKEIEEIRNDIPKDVREGEVEVYDEDSAMLCGAEDQLQMVITDLKLLLEE